MLSGFTSSVISAPGAIENAPVSERHMRSNAHEPSALGVPPPKNTDVNAVPSAAGARSAISSSSAPRNRSTAARDKPVLEKWQ